MTSNNHIIFRNDKSHGVSELYPAVIPIDALVDTGDIVGEGHVRNVTQYHSVLHSATNLPHFSQLTSDFNDYWELHADSRLFSHVLSPSIDADHCNSQQSATSDFSSLQQLLSPTTGDFVLTPGTPEMCTSINGDAHERQSSSSNSGSDRSSISPLLNTSPWSLTHPLSPIDSNFQLYFGENINSEASSDGALYNPLTNDERVEHEETLLQGHSLSLPPSSPPLPPPLPPFITATPDAQHHTLDIQQCNSHNLGEISEGRGKAASRDISRIASSIVGKKRKVACPDNDLVSTITTIGNTNGNGRRGSNKDQKQHKSKRSRHISPKVVDRDGIELTIIYGIKEPTSVKQPGGKGNKKALPRFVIETNISRYSKGESLVQLAMKEQLVIEALLIGNKDGVETDLDVIASTFVRIDKDEATTVTKFITSFASLVVRVASHSYGRRLFVRFRLMDKERDVCLQQVDSGTFETITQRGIEKQRKKRHADTAPTMNAKPKSRIDGVEPSVGCLHGSQLVKIVGSFKTASATDVSVVFGDRESLNIYCVKKNFIICETPVLDKLGNVEVRISLDGKKTFVNNARQPAMFQVVDANREDGRLLVVQQLMTKSVT